MVERKTGFDASRGMLCEFGTDFFFIADKDDLHIGEITERLNSSRNGILRGMIPTHRVEGNFHPGKIRPSELLCADGENLAFVVISAGWAGYMSRDGCAALGALGELRGLPAVCRLACAKAHFRCFAFRNSHNFTLFLILACPAHPMPARNFRPAARGQSGSHRDARGIAFHRRCRTWDAKAGQGAYPP